MGTDLTWYLLSFRGRISRQEFWLGCVGIFAVALLLRRLLPILSLAYFRPTGGSWYRDELDWALAMPKAFVGAILIWPMVAIAAKRLHDLNLSAWWLLLFPATSVAAKLASFEHWNVVMWVGIGILGVLPGSRADNRFGADPLRRADP